MVLLLGKIGCGLFLHTAIVERDQAVMLDVAAAQKFGDYLVPLPSVMVKIGVEEGLSMGD
jgi:hypothetical protein